MMLAHNSAQNANTRRVIKMELAMRIHPTKKGYSAGLYIRKERTEWGRDKREVLGNTERMGEDYRSHWVWQEMWRPGRISSGNRSKESSLEKARKKVLCLGRYKHCIRYDSILYYLEDGLCSGWYIRSIKISDSLTQNAKVCSAY